MHVPRSPAAKSTWRSSRPDSAHHGCPSRPTEDLRNNGRGYSYEYSGGAEQQIGGSLSVAGMYFYRNLRRYVTTDYTDRTQADYTAVPVVSPLNGEVFNVYNLAASKVPLTNRVDRIAFDDLRYNNYRGIEFSFRYRLPKGGSVFGGTSTGRTLAVTCDQPDNPNLLRFCDQTVDGVSPPIQTSFKLAANYPLPQNVRFGISYVRQPGGALNTNWLITRTTRYPNTPCSAPCVPGGLVVPNLSRSLGDHAAQADRCRPPGDHQQPRPSLRPQL